MKNSASGTYDESTTSRLNRTQYKSSNVRVCYYGCRVIICKSNASRNPRKLFCTCPLPMDIDAKDVAICRVEELCPFLYDLVQRELKQYPNAEVVWCQEEPMNIGGYTYVKYVGKKLLVLKQSTV